MIALNAQSTLVFQNQYVKRLSRLDALIWYMRQETYTASWWGFRFYASLLSWWEVNWLKRVQLKIKKQIEKNKEFQQWLESRTNENPIEKEIKVPLCRLNKAFSEEFEKESDTFKRIQTIALRFRDTAHKHRVSYPEAINETCAGTI